MPLFERSFTDLLGESINELASDTRITRVSPGAKARAILEIINRNISQAYKIFDLNFARAFLSGATGRYLDLIGELLGVPRLGIETAKASASSQVVKFFVDTGTFGDINSSSAITIPAGTILSTLPDTKGILYRTTIGTVLSVSSSSQFISVEAVNPGEVSNIGASSLSFHNFTTYTDVANNTLKVTNTSAIFNGANIENDTNYKFRIAKSALASEAANQTACFLAALQVPGVANVIMQNRAMGIGTYRVLIKSVTPTVSDNLLSDVEAALSKVSAQGIVAQAVGPAETGMSFTLTMIYKNGTSSTEKDQIDEQVRLAVQGYVNNLDIGEEFIINELVERILSVSDSIKDIGEPNKPIDEVFVHRVTRLQDNKVKEQLITNYDPADNERLIIEPSLDTPITIIRAN